MWPGKAFQGGSHETSAKSKKKKEESSTETTSDFLTEDRVSRHQAPMFPGAGSIHPPKPLGIGSIPHISWDKLLAPTLLGQVVSAPMHEVLETNFKVSLPVVPFSLP